MSDPSEMSDVELEVQPSDSAEVAAAKAAEADARLAGQDSEEGQEAAEEAVEGESSGP